MCLLPSALPKALLLHSLHGLIPSLFLCVLLGAESRWLLSRVRLQKQLAATVTCHYCLLYTFEKKAQYFLLPNGEFRCSLVQIHTQFFFYRGNTVRTVHRGVRPVRPYRASKFPGPKKISSTEEGPCIRVRLERQNPVRVRPYLRVATLRACRFVFSTPSTEAPRRFAFSFVFVSVTYSICLKSQRLVSSEH